MKENIIENSNQNYFAFNVDKIYNLRLIHTDEEEINSKDKKFIEDLKELSTQEERCFIVFDKKDVTLKIDIDEVDIKILKQKYYYKVDAKINDIIKPKNIIKILNQIPKHFELRLEAGCFDEIFKLMISKTLIEKLIKQGTKFLYKGIEIEPRIIESKMDGDYLKNEVKEIKAKRGRLRMDCDK